MLNIYLGKVLSKSKIFIVCLGTAVFITEPMFVRFKFVLICLISALDERNANQNRLNNNWFHFKKFLKLVMTFDE